MSFTIPENAPFTGPQRMWLKGFLDGISSMLPSSGGSSAAAVADVSKPGLPVTILWGSQTGSAEGFAKKLSKKLGSSGHSATVIDMANATVEQLSSIENLLVITSTYGDGEPPDNAIGFHGALHAADVSHANIHYAVFALGDSNYPEFCKCGHDFDKRLTALGATPMLSIIESDVDHDGPFAEWSKKLESALSSRLATH